MSKLNANAFAFVPGQGPRISKQPANTAVPIERPLPTEAPLPAPTISLNIGHSTPVLPRQANQPDVPPLQAPPPAASVPASVSGAQTTQSSTHTNSKAGSTAPGSGPSKSFTLEKAKTDTAAIVDEVKNAVDESTLHDLFGSGVLCRRMTHIFMTNAHHSKRTSEHRIYWPRRRREEHHGRQSSLPDGNSRQAHHGEIRA